MRVGVSGRHAISLLAMIRQLFFADGGSLLVRYSKM
jgi:hypothetical protein